ncbi:MAG: ATP synthase F1 subunit epsilon [Aestuariivita sp.]|nr:ATP synthase F1 subunit epsilon [Aestuariivita sp.]MCY4202193.1 ATP synthase F1 subunit epsilon [Aestuariivita sp.]MCY4289794.1 ATP synthase F1 subunit epsilon [Aestuariivita sp.]MCY4347422.1 ATP synthase F1 subunit epsilon [Aestuariivita sp.]
MIPFELVSPERRLATMEVQGVRIPGSEGDMTVMAHHAPLISTLRPGILGIESSEEPQEYIVFGGFTQVTAERVSVLAERAVPKSEFTEEILSTEIEQAENAVTKAEASSDHAAIDGATKRLADIRALAAHVA